MAEYLTNTTDLTKVASAIREKGGTSDSLVYPDGFVAAIQAIQTGTELKIIVSVTSGATVTATKGSLSVSGTSVNGTCTLVVPEEGDWTVSATLGGETSVVEIVTISSSTDVYLPFVSSTLDDNSWETISLISDKDQGANYWAVGDTKKVTLNGTVGIRTFTNYETYAFILGFNHNSGVEGEHRIHFELGKTAKINGIDVCYCDEKYFSTPNAASFCMNTSATTAGGWKESYARNNICGENVTDANTIVSALPEDLRNKLKVVIKWTHDGKGTQTQSATQDIVFYKSEYETYGTNVYAGGIEAKYQKQYEYYSAGNSTIIYKDQSTSTAARCWLRSPRWDSGTDFVFIFTNGKTVANNAAFSLGIAPCFCV